VQTLGLSESTPRTESRLKSLFWPTIKNQWDLDYVTNQGFWICVLVGSITFAFGLIATGGIFGLVDFAFYLLAGCGVRRRSRAAALIAFFIYAFSGLALQIRTGQGFGIMWLIFVAILLANVRGIWLSAAWPESTLPGSMTLLDRVSDQLPAILWPRMAWLFYILAALEVVGLVMLFITAGRPG
jgi:hypothetical protein